MLSWGERLPAPVLFVANWGLLPSPSNLADQVTYDTARMRAAVLAGARRCVDLGVGNNAYANHENKHKHARARSDM